MGEVPPAVGEPAPNPAAPDPAVPETGWVPEIAGALESGAPDPLQPAATPQITATSAPAAAVLTSGRVCLVRLMASMVSRVTGRGWLGRSGDPTCPGGYEAAGEGN